MTNTDDKYYAYFEHETVQALLHSLFRFQSAMQAQLVSNRFADQVILAPKMSDPKDRKAIIVWVRDMDVTPEQRKLGYLGNYGKIVPVQLKDGRWTLKLSLLNVPLAKHPLILIKDKAGAKRKKVAAKQMTVRTKAKASSTKRPAAQKEKSVSRAKK